MQVFVTSKSYVESAMNLDSRRANKQIIECNQIYRALIGESKGWRNHCVSRLWGNYLDGLMYFAWCCYFELKFRGNNPARPIEYKNYERIAQSNARILDVELLVGNPPQSTHFMRLPWWVNAMRSHLLAKDPEHYSQFKWNLPAEFGYYALDKDYNWKKYSIREV